MIYDGGTGNFNEFKRIVDRTIDALKDVKFDTIVVRGMSGATVGPSVALAMGKNWALVRKPGDSAHSRNKIEGVIYSDYVIVDDFPESGATIRSIEEAVKEGKAQLSNVNGCAKCVGVYFYTQWFSIPNKTVRKELTEKLGGIKILN